MMNTDDRLSAAILETADDFHIRITMGNRGQV
jgi:hypothetical protein